MYIIGEFEPLVKYEGYVVAVIKRANDVEEKLVVCKELNKYNKEQIKVLVEFQERFFDTVIMTYWIYERVSILKNKGKVKKVRFITYEKEKNAIKLEKK